MRAAIGIRLATSPLAGIVLTATMLATVPLPGRVAAAAESAIAAGAGERTTRVSYLAGNSVYVEAGRAEGLALGDSLTVVRGSEALAVLRVAYLSTHRASCEIVSVTSAPVIGDVVRFCPGATAPAPGSPAAAPEAATAPPAGTSALPSLAAPSGPISRPLRGRIGARFLGAQSRDAGDFGQVGLDLRLDGHDLGAWPLDVSADIRSRHSTTTSLGSDPAATITRVYRLSASLHGWDSNRRVTVGRQSSTALGAVSLFDGLLAEFGGERWRTGVFTGTQPDPEALGLSGQIVEYGAYGEWRQPPGTERRWSLGGGGVASFESGELNRNFIFIQGYYRDPRLALSLSQEVDVNYGWKRDAGDPAIMPTSTYVSGRTQVSPAFALEAGYDNRRNVRLYRDRDTPATEFDDRIRQGVWAGASARAGAHLTFGGDVRFHGDGSDAGRGHSWSVNALAARLVPYHARAGVRWSRFTGDRTESQLLGVTLGIDPNRRLHAELGGGLRNTVDSIADLEEQELWESIDLDLGLGGRMFMTMGLEHIHGTVDRRLEEELGLSWGF